MSTDPKPTALLIEIAEIAFIEAQIEAACQLFPGDGFSAKRVGSGVAAVTKASFGRKLNHVAGFGMNGPVTEADLETIEQLYKAIGVAPEINLCPFAHPTAVKTLTARGYKICAQMSVYTLSLRDLGVGDGEKCRPAATSNPGITIDRVGEDEYGNFIKYSILGFESTGQPVELLKTLAEMAVRRPDTYLYFARIDGRIAGCAGMALIRTPVGNVAELFIDSTVPEFRGQGVQRVLLKQRLVAAERSGMEVATATTWPGGTSARNLEREGFRLAFTKDVHTKGN
ncbi:hypothetical protein BDV12DRAFT_208119 [Aspergillus spectabilis]